MDVVTTNTITDVVTKDVVTIDLVTTNAITYVVTTDVVTKIHFILLVKA